jgi:PAS domain S-box-containing protein
MQHDYFDENHRLKGIVETAPFPIGVYTGHELRIELANAKMIETYGKGPDVVGKCYTDILPELQNQEIFGQLRGVLTSGIPYHAVNRRVDIMIGGILKKHYFNYSFTPLYDSQGTLYGVMNTAADVTELNLARQQTSDTEDKLRLALEAAELGTYEIDIATGAIRTSGNFRRIWDIDGSVTQEAIIARLHPDDLHIREAAHRNAGLTGSISYETRILHRDEAVRWLRIKGKFITDEHGVRVALIGIVQDITEQKQFAQQLETLVEKRTAELQRSNDDLLHFAHVISHDLKEPVRKISVFNGMLEHDYAGVMEERGQNFLKKVKAATDRMAAMIDGVLTYSTINAAGYPAEEVDLNTIVENIKLDLELVIEEKKAILIKEHLPVVEGSPILLHQLFYNLVNNALKFSKAEEPPRVVIQSETSVSGGKEFVSITVSDNGIGFGQEYTEKIFNVFERLHPKDTYDGTGLGLALCRKIVERHNGSLTANGRINEGADFIIRLPLRQTTEKL